MKTAAVNFILVAFFTDMENNFFKTTICFITDQLNERGFESNKPAIVA